MDAGEARETHAGIYYDKGIYGDDANTALMTPHTQDRILRLCKIVKRATGMSYDEIGKQAMQDAEYLAFRHEEAEEMGEAR